MTDPSNDRCITLGLRVQGRGALHLMVATIWNIPFEEWICISKNECNYYLSLAGVLALATAMRFTSATRRSPTSRLAHSVQVSRMRYIPQRRSVPKYGARVLSGALCLVSRSRGAVLGFHGSRPRDPSLSMIDAFAPAQCKCLGC